MRNCVALTYRRSSRGQTFVMLTLAITVLILFGGLTIDFGVAYTYGNFRYRTYSVAGIDYAGNRIPGVPARALQMSATARMSAISIVGEEILSDRVFVDDANSSAAPGYGTTNLRFIADEFIPRSGISLLAGVYNLFDRKYAGSVAINATAGKFFEPAQRRSAFAGFNLSFAQKPRR